MSFSWAWRRHRFTISPQPADAVLSRVNARGQYPVVQAFGVLEEESSRFTEGRWRGAREWPGDLGAVRGPDARSLFASRAGPDAAPGLALSPWRGAGASLRDCLLPPELKPPADRAPANHKFS